MEFPKLKHPNMEKFGPLKFRNNFPTKEGITIRALQTENIFLKNKLAEFESRLELMPIAISYDKFQSKSINLKNEKPEDSKPRKLKSARAPKRIDAFLVNNVINETNEANENNLEEENKQEFNIPNKSFSRLSSAKTNNSSRVKSARNNDVLARINSSKQIHQRILSAINPSDLSNRSSTTDTFETITSNQTNNSVVDKIDGVLENLKKHRRSLSRNKTAEELNIKPRPKTSNTIILENEVKPESAKKKNRSKSARKSAKKDDYKHTFYSNSWRIHSEFMGEEPDRTAPWDNTISLFYKTKRKMPETFIFAPDWI